MDHGCQNYNYVLRFYIFVILIKGLDSTILVNRIYIFYNLYV